MIIGPVGALLKNKLKRLNSDDETISGKNPEEKGGRGQRKEEFGQTFHRWTNKTDPTRLAKSSQNKKHEMIDPSLATGDQGMDFEATQRLGRLKLSNQYLDNQFRDSQIFVTKEDRAHGKVLSSSKNFVFGYSRN